MAVPFFEPKATTVTANSNNNNVDNNNNSNNNAVTTTPAATMHYDQVDGMLNSFAEQQPTITTLPTAPEPTPTPISTSTLTATATSTSSVNVNINSATTLPTTLEQQAIAWKILALALCKALKEYYQQTASSKDAFTSQTVQVLPNGKVQPLWK